MAVAVAAGVEVVVVVVVVVVDALDEKEVEEERRRRPALQGPCSKSQMPKLRSSARPDEAEVPRLRGREPETAGQFRVDGLGAFLGFKQEFWIDTESLLYVNVDVSGVAVQTGSHKDQPRHKPETPDIPS